MKKGKWKPLTFAMLPLLMVAVAPLDAKDEPYRLEDALEQAIFLEEGKGDLAAAAKAYQKILEESEVLDALAAETKFRLAGVYLAQGKEAIAHALLEEVVNQYPAAVWAEQAKELLPQEFTPEITPWHDGERTRYDWRLPTGDIIGRSVETIYEFEWEGKKLWRKESRHLIGGNRATAVEFDPVSFETAYSNMYLSEMGNVRSWYRNGAKSVEVSYSKSGEDRTFDFDHQVFDNEQALSLIRQLPAEVGYRMSKSIFVSFSGNPIRVSFEVEGLEEVETGIGTLECFKIAIDLVAQRQYVYVTADERRLVVRMIVGGLVSEITDVETVDVDGKFEYYDEANGYRIELPGTWSTIPARKGTEMVHIAEPMARGEYLLTVRDNERWKEDYTLDIAGLERFIRRELKADLIGFEPVEDWQGNLSLPFAEAKSFKLEFSGGGRNEEAFVYIGLDDRRHCIMLARVPTEEKAELLPVFENILRSLKFD